MNGASTRDVVGGILGVAALICGIVQFFYVPLALGPTGVVLLIAAIMTSPKYRGLYELTALVLTVGVVVGTAIAIVADNPLY